VLPYIIDTDFINIAISLFEQSNTSILLSCITFFYNLLTDAENHTLVISKVEDSIDELLSNLENLVQSNNSNLSEAANTLVTTINEM
jgi:hypothetical protein